MDKGKDFENILDDCLDRLIGGETIESCLARYPEHAAELKPLLKTALEAKKASALQPRPEFRRHAGIEFQKAIAEMPSIVPTKAFRWQLRWVLPVAVFLVLFAGGTGTLVAATNSLPDSPLYGLKLATEQVQLAFTFSSEAKAELYARFVDFRVAEIAQMAEEGYFEQVEQATERMSDQLLAMADLNIGGLDYAKAENASMFALAVPSEEQTTTGTTAPTVANVPAPPVIPAPTTTPTTTVIVPAASGPERDAVAYEDAGALSDIDRLKLLLRERYEQNLQILLEQLERVPEAIKPTLQQAIDILRMGYELAIASLG